MSFDGEPVKKSLTVPIAASLAMAGVYAAVTLWFARDLPAHLATHFNAAGRPNGWQSRQEFINFSFAIGLGVQVFVAALCYATRYLPARFVNLPHKEYWQRPENFPMACHLTFRFSLWLGCMLLLWMGLINYQIVQANKLMPPRLDTTSLMTALGTCLIMMIVWFICMWREFRVPVAARKPKA